MKKFLFIILGLFTFALFAQVEQAQTYTYPVDKYFNYLVHQKDTTIYTAPYSGNLFKLSNLNQKLDKTGDFFKIYLFKLKNNTFINKLWHHKKLVVYEKDTTYKVSIPKNLSYLTKANNKILFISQNNDALYQFKNNHFDKIKTFDSSYKYNFTDDYLYRYKSDSVSFANLKDLKKIKFGKNIYVKNIYEIHYYKNDKNFIYSTTKENYFYYPNTFLSNRKNIKTLRNWVLIKRDKKYTIENTKQKYNIPITQHINNFCVDEKHQIAYFGTSNQLKKSFLYLSKFPNVFKNNSSKSCFTLSKDDKGTIYVGSYNRDFSVIKNDSVQYIDNNNLKFLIGSIHYKNSMYFISENNPNGIFKFENGKFSFIKGSDKYSKNKHTTGFYLFKSSKDKIYYATNQSKIFEINGEDLLKNNGNWNEIKTHGNTLTITEDNFGRIYYVDNKGIGIYNPSNRENTHFTHKKLKTSSVLASVKDAYGTLWFGGRKGLTYLKPNTKTATLKNFKKINHPFFQDKTIITAMTIYKNHLIIAKQNKILVLDIDKFNKNGEINVKYLTQHETNFTASTEQNTMLVDKNNDIWFATTDMIYKWNFDKWLNLPKTQVKPSIFIEKNAIKTLLKNDKITLKPYENSFQLSYDYHTSDLLPRYTQYALQYENDSIIWSPIKVRHTIEKRNLKAGTYHFYLKIFELDGTTSIIKKQIKIPLFWFEKWQFWILIMGGVILLFSMIYYKFYTIEKEKSHWQKEVSKINRKLSKFQLTSISNQFRPHFLLNTFNTIGANFEAGSSEEKLLDTLGNSIDILFSMAKKGNNHHNIKNEWQLVVNVIEIYKNIYIKDLNVKLPKQDFFDKNNGFILPFGILQIPVENALLHGLHNKPNPPYNLKINAFEDDVYVVFEIIDDGVGIDKAKKLSNVRKNGTGLKNLHKIIEILNNYNQTKIEINFEDVLIGTKVSILIPKNYNYEIK